VSALFQLLLVATLFLPQAEWAGTWQLSKSDSDFGMSPAPDSALTIIERADDRLVMTRKVWTSMAGHNDVRFDMPTDGQQHYATRAGGADIPARVWWEDEVLAIEVVVESNVGELTVTDRVTLSDDGRQLVFDRVLDVPQMGPMEQTIVYLKRDRQTD